MRKNRVRSRLPVIAALIVAVPGSSFAQGLGATKLDGLGPFVDCQNRARGYREKLMADRIEAKLAKSPALNAQEREAWMANIRALRAVTPAKSQFVAPDPKNPQQYLDGLTGPEQQAINSMAVRHGQEINLECEKKYGGMTRYSPGSDQSNQRKYEDSLRANMQTPIDIASAPVGVLGSPFPKTKEQLPAEQRTAREATKARQQAAVNAAMQGLQNAAAKQAACQERVKSLRLTLLVPYLQRRLNASQGLSAKDRSDFEADIQAARDGAARGLDVPPPVDPANPMRAMMRLTPQDQVAYGEEYGRMYYQQMATCQGR